MTEEAENVTTPGDAVRASRENDQPGEGESDLAGDLQPQTGSKEVFLDLARSDEEIMETLAVAEGFIQDKTEDRYSFLTYEEGVRNGLQWVLGRSLKHPLESGDESH